MATVNLQQELEALAAAFEGRGVPYALCGGLALAVHGHPRATKDVDFLIAGEDVERAKDAARTLGFVLAAAPMTFASGVEVHRVSKVAEGAILMLDLIVVGEALRSAWSSRQRVPTRAGGLWVVSREGLIAMKVAASRPQDLLDIQKLGEQP